MNTDRENEDSLVSEIIGVDWAADDAIATGLSPEHFQYRENGIIYFVVKDQREHGLPVNATDVIESLRFCGYDDQMVGACVARIDAARLETKTGTSVEYYARKIMAAWRQLQHRVSIETMQRDIGNGTDWQQAEAQHQARLDNLTQTAGNGMQSFSETSEQLIAEMEGRLTPGLKTGFCDIDNAISGFRPGNLIVLVGPTGGGKSALALGIAINVAQRSQRVCIVSAEMTTAELHERTAAVFASVNPMDVRRQQLSDSEKQRWRSAVYKAETLPVSIDRNRTLSSVVFGIRASHRRQPWDLVIVDYAQLIEADGHNREREVAAVSGALKGLAADLGIPVIILAQMNKDFEKREDKRPRLSDIRESMALAHDSDIVLMLHRPSDHDIEANPTDMQVFVRKGRSINQGSIQMTFRKEFTRFEDYVSPDDRFADLSVPSDRGQR